MTPSNQRVVCANRLSGTYDTLVAGETILSSVVYILLVEDQIAALEHTAWVHGIKQPIYSGRIIHHFASITAPILLTYRSGYIFSRHKVIDKKREEEIAFVITVHGFVNFC